MKNHLSTVLIFVFSLTVAGQNNTTKSKIPAIDLLPCEVAGAAEGKKEKVLCGRFEVFENRVAKTGRRISLNIEIFPATGLDKLSDPVFYVAGGPGGSAVEEAPYFAEDMAKIREHRDLVFLDQRGTGGSNPLNCEFFNPEVLQSYLGHWNPPDQVRRCRQELERKADLRLYVTSIAVDDLDEVRAALGYNLINLVAGSYGTRFSQEYIRRHGEHVRSAVLQGISTTNQFMPRDFPQQTERALQGVLAECNDDHSCRKAFPNIRAETKAVLAKLITGPVDTVVTRPHSNETTHVTLSRDLAGEAVRYMLYNPGSASRIPLLLHLAARGNFAPLAEAAINYRQEFVASGSGGMYLSVTCAEDLPWISRKDTDNDYTFLGGYRLRQQREACDEWPRGQIPNDYFYPVRSNVPILIFTGQWDPVTPPLYGKRISKYLPNSRHIIVPSGGHGFDGLEGLTCISQLDLEFLTSANPKSTDTSCVKEIHRAGFALTLIEDRN